MADAPFHERIGKLIYGGQGIGGLEEALAALAEGLRQGRGAAAERLRPRKKAPP